jgi:hypothetical protein
VNASRIAAVTAAAAVLVVSILFPLPVPAAFAAGTEPTAAQVNGWGAPTRSEDFTGDLGQWSLYNGPGHDGNGRRTPSAAGVADGILTINGDADGNSEGMAWGAGAMYGRWEARMRASAGDRDYHAVLLLWPDGEDEGGYGGEVDFMENSDPSRQNTEMFVHYDDEDTQLRGAVHVDATQWHNWAVEWSPDHITAYLDGEQWWSTSLSAAQPPGPMHMTIQLDQFRDGGGLKPSNLQVDWVRYYPIEGSGPSPAPVNADGTCGRVPPPVPNGPVPPVSGAPGAGVADAAAAAAAAGCSPGTITLP